MRFMAFDLPAHDGVFAVRTRALATLLAEANTTTLERIPQHQFASRAALDRRLQAVMANGGEGLMLQLALAP